MGWATRTRQAQLRAIVDELVRLVENMIPAAEQLHALLTQIEQASDIEKPPDLPRAIATVAGTPTALRTCAAQLRALRAG